METTKSFIEQFVRIALESGYLDEMLVHSWILFLENIIEHIDIPNCKFKARAVHLLVLFLNPFINIRLTNVNVPDAFKQTVVESVQRILKVAPKGFIYTIISADVATELTKAVESYPEFFINDSQNCLNYYKMLLNQEANSV